MKHQAVVAVLGAGALFFGLSSFEANEDASGRFATRLLAALCVGAALFLAGCAFCSVGPDRTTGVALGQARCGVFAAPERVATPETDASPEPQHTPDRLALGIEGGGLTPTGYEAIGAGIAAVVTILTALITHGVL